VKQENIFCDRKKYFLKTKLMGFKFQVSSSKIDD